MCLIRLLFDYVAKLGDAEPIRRGRNAPGIGGEEGEAILFRPREREDLLLFPGDIPQQPDGNLFSDLASCGQSGLRTGEIADVNAIETRPVASVGTFANLN